MIRTLASDRQIVLNWDYGVTGDVYRSADGGATWELLAELQTDTFTDFSAVPGVVYRYKVDEYGVEYLSGEVWLVPLVSWQVARLGIVDRGRANRPTFRARIVDAAVPSRALSARDVESVSLTVWGVLDNDVTERPRFFPITESAAVEPTGALLPNLVADAAWPDADGFNFQHSPDIDLDPGDYALRYVINLAAGGRVLVNFRYSSASREA